jgi:hypothetical protein
MGPVTVTEGGESGRIVTSTSGDAHPACWSWPLPRGDYDDAPEALLRDFQQGRCAICGAEKPDLVTDHDHYTGFVRGKLCRFCNAQEGRRTTPLLAEYRKRHPGAILGLELIYTAPLWDYEQDAGKFHGPRPEGRDIWTNNVARSLGL